MINTDYSQYKAFAEANEHAKRLSKEIITEVKTDLSKGDANVPSNDSNTDAADRLYDSNYADSN